MGAIFQFLKGKKTYFVVAAALVYAGYGVYTGAMDTDTAIKTVLAALGLGGVRSALNAHTDAVVDAVQNTADKS